MNNMLEEALGHEEKTMFSWKRVTIVVAIFVVVGSLAFGGFVAYGKQYEGRVLPGVHLGDVPIGGMDRNELRSYITTMHEKLLTSGISITFVTQDGENKTFVIDPVTSSNDFQIELIHLQLEKELDSILENSTHENMLTQSWAVLSSRITTPHVSLQYVEIEKDRLFEELREELGPYETVPANAGIEITSVDPVEYTTTTSTVGVTYNYNAIAGQVVSAWSQLSQPVMTVTSEVKEPTVRKAELVSLEEPIARTLALAPVTFVYTNPATQKQQTFTLDKQMLVPLLEPQKTAAGELVIGVSASSTAAYFEKDIAPEVTVEAQDARFTIGAGGKVSEFRGSRAGVGLDTEATIATLQDQMHAASQGVTATSTVALVVKTVEPTVKTGDINDLGVNEILGVGHSKFNGSSGLRIKNIRHGAMDKLHGRLIKPGEDFSLVTALKPFTLEDGYVPEKVIKGNRLEVEIGGGLCQIGSTIFRAAMNSGLPITERRNHGLVVSYYNDLSNGLPGTDATIYDPSPDFRFLNDTGNYVLISVDMNESTGDLYITLWGTSDGRKGYYTPPKVLQWIPAGPEQRIVSPNLPPGKVECQAAFTGAVAQFTYVRELPNGEKKNEVFTSHYRAVPRICLVGPSVEVPQEPAPEQPTAEPVADPTVDPQAQS